MSDQRDPMTGDDPVGDPSQSRPASSPDDRDQDRLLQLLGVRALADLDGSSAADEQFLEWWARELRMVNRDAAGIASRAADFESRVRARIAERDHRVRILMGEPRRRPSPIEGTVAGLMDQAAAARCVPALDLRVAAGVGRELWDESCTSWIELPDDVRSGQHVALTVAGDSMEPLLYDGDTILVRIGAALERDAVIVARRPDEGYVVKRVARFGPRVVELTSLHPGFPPIRIPRRDDLVLGTVLLCWRKQRR